MTQQSRVRLPPEAIKVKTCISCSEEKPEDAFYWKWKAKGLRRSDCKDCFKKVMKPRSKAHYEANKPYYFKRNRRRQKELQAFLRELKHNKRCKDCKKRFPYWQLQFDHLDPSSKLANVSSLTTRGKKKLLEEIEKCDLVCANCHADRTFRRREVQ